MTQITLNAFSLHCRGKVTRNNHWLCKMAVQKSFAQISYSQTPCSGDAKVQEILKMTCQKKKTLKIGSIFRKKLFIRRQYSLVGNFLCFCFLDLGPILAVSFFFDKFWNFFRICNLCHIFGCFSAMYSQILMTQGFLDSSHVALSMKNGLNQNRSLQEGFFHRCL